MTVMTQNTIYDACESIYAKPIINLKVNDIIKYGKKNRLDILLYTMNSHDVNAASHIELSKYEAYKICLVSAIDCINSILKDEKWLLFKTVSSYEHTTSDIDILLMNTADYNEKKKTINAKWSQLNIGKDIKKLEIDVHNVLDWSHTEDISSDYIWKNISTDNFQGREILVPNKELDVLIRLAHIPFEVGHVKLGELMHIYYQSRNIDWAKLEKEAMKMSWPKTFYKMRLLINDIHIFLFNKELFSEEGMYEETKKYEFPYSLSYFELAKSVIEKRAWKKIWGGRYILRDRLLNR